MLEANIDFLLTRRGHAKIRELIGVRGGTVLVSNDGQSRFGTLYYWHAWQVEDAWRHAGDHGNVWTFDIPAEDGLIPSEELGAEIWAT